MKEGKDLTPHKEGLYLVFKKKKSRFGLVYLNEFIPDICNIQLFLPVKLNTAK